MDAFLHSMVKKGKQMQSKAGTHHGDVVEGITSPEEQKLQQYRECLDLVSRLREASLALVRHAADAGFGPYAPLNGEQLEDLEGRILKAVFRLKGTI